MNEYIFVQGEVGTMLWNGLPLVIFGSGGISKEIYCLIDDINRSSFHQSYDFIGFVGSSQDEVGNEIIDNFNIISSDDQFVEFASKYPIIGIVIPLGDPIVKKKIYDKFKYISNAVFPNLFHPTISFNKNNLIIGQGNIITAGVNLTCDIKIGDFNLFNLNSTVGHDTLIGNFNVINPSASISGNVTVKDCCLIGTGAQILQGLNVNDRSTVGAGAVVVRDVNQNATVIGVPAKTIK